ncbi:hypothetical protein DRQ20_01815 [bacterium]|nr:MAG: hypothetical protein DRQ20_01815 [bacterium]
MIANLILLILSWTRGGRWSLWYVFYILLIYLLRFRPVSLLKFSYLTLTYGLSVFLYLLHGNPQTATILFFGVLISDLLRKMGLWKSLVNASAYSLAILIAGAIIPDPALSLPLLYTFFFLNFFFTLLFFYLPEFIERKVSLSDFVFIMKWEVIYYLLALLFFYNAWKVVSMGHLLPIILYTAGAGIVYLFIRPMVINAIDAYNLKMFMEMERAMSAGLSLDEMIKKIESLSRHLIDWTGMNIAVLDEERGEIVLYYSSYLGFMGKDKSFVVKVGEGIVGNAVLEKKPIIVKDTSRDPRYIALREGVYSEIAIPLLIEGEVVGVIDFEHSLKNAFSEKELQFAYLFADHLARALKTHMTLSPLRSISASLRGEGERLKENVSEMKKVHEEIREEIEKGLETNLVRKEIGEKLRGLVEDMVGWLEGEEKKRREIVEKGKEKVLEGRGKLGDVERSMEGLNEVRKGIEEMVQEVGRVNEGLENIERLLRISKQIASNTETLAFNATIEAARAGEMGKGFGVVAEEISKLAKEADAASDEIGKTVDEFRHIVDSLIRTAERNKERTGIIEESSQKVGMFVQELMRLLEDMVSLVEEEIKIGEREVARIKELKGEMEKERKIDEEMMKLLESVREVERMEKELVSSLGELEKEIGKSLDKLHEIMERFSL